MTTTDQPAQLEPLYHVAHLREGGEVDPAALSQVFAAPWQTVALVNLEPGQTFGGRDLHDSEAMVFVTAGSGVAQLGHGPVALREAISLTLFMGERLELRAGPAESLAFFFVEIRKRPAVQATA
jgi:quercetin dioxygenase-like cupin family protein